MLLRHRLLVAAGVGAIGLVAAIAPASQASPSPHVTHHAVGPAMVPTLTSFGTALQARPLMKPTLAIRDTTVTQTTRMQMPEGHRLSPGAHMTTMCGVVSGV